jgi:hypothetical protein
MKKNLFFSMRITKDERKALSDIERLEGLNASVIIRLLIREGLEKRGLPPVGINQIIKKEK